MHRIVKQIINCIVVVPVCSVMVNARPGKTRTVIIFYTRVQVTASPARFNLLLISENNKGSLNTDLSILSTFIQ